jgi:glycosyltransferase involved in cell wall biosynthesis
MVNGGNGSGRKGSWSIGILLHDFQLGGAERCAIRLANAWAGMGGEVVLFAGGGGGQQALVGKGVRVEIAAPPIPRRRDSPLQLGRWAATHPSAAHIDAFLLPGNSYFRAAGAMRTSAARGARLYATISNLLWRPDRSLFRNLVFSLLTSWRLRRLSGLIGMSVALLREAQRIRTSGSALAVLPNALFESLPAVPVAKRLPWHICAAGRLVAQKNFPLSLQVVALLQDLPITLSIVGDGPQMAALRHLAESLGVAGRVRFVGEVPDASACIAQAEVLLLTSDYEGYPAVVVEALAVGTYVVASDCSPAMSELLHAPLVGTVVAGGRAEHLAAAVRDFFAGSARGAWQARVALAHARVQSHVAAEAARQHLEFMGLVAAPKEARQSLSDA